MTSREILRKALREIGVTRINSISKYDDLPIYVYQTCRPNSLHLTVDSGKGKTDDAAFIACAVEAIERYTAENIENEKMSVSLDNENLFIPNGTKTYEKVSSSRHLECYEGTEMISNRKVLVPTNYVDYKKPQGLLSSQSFAGTTGLGAHTTMEKAICSGLVELIERDAIAQGKYERVIPEMIDESLSWIKSTLGERCTRYAILRYETEWPLEVVQIVCNDPYVAGGMNAMGVGASLQLAIEDAALEAMQTWLMRLAASRDDWAYSRVMDREIFDQFISSKTKIIKKGNKETNSRKYSDKLYFKLIEYAELAAKEVVVVPLKTNVEIKEIYVVKVLLDRMKLLRQGPMLTGIPYMPSV